MLQGLPKKRGVPPISCCFLWGRRLFLKRRDLWRFTTWLCGIGAAGCALPLKRVKVWGTCWSYPVMKSYEKFKGWLFNATCVGIQKGTTLKNGSCHSYFFLYSSKTLNKIEKHPLMEHHFCLGTPSFYSFFTGPACGITDLACPFDPQTTQNNMSKLRLARDKCTRSWVSWWRSRWCCKTQMLHRAFSHPYPPKSPNDPNCGKIVPLIENHGYHTSNPFMGK